MGIRVARCVEKMLEPGPARDAARVKPVGFDLHQAAVHGGDHVFFQAIPLERGRQVLCDGAAFFLERFQALLEAAKVNVLSESGARIEFAEKTPERRAIGAKIKRKKIRVREPQSEQTPDAAERDVVFKLRIADALHPKVIVVSGMIDAVVTGKTETDDRTPEMIQKNSVIRAASYPGLDERR